MTEVMKEFKISKKEQGAFKYIGLNIEQTDKAIFVDQMEYVKSLKEIDISAERKNMINDALDETEKKQLRSLCGQLLWVTSQTRPDVSFQGCMLSNYGKNATVKSLVEANKAIRVLKSQDIKLIFSGLGQPEQIKVVAYGDDSHNSLPNGDSQGATEISAVADTADYAYLVASMLQEIFCLEKSPIVELMTDSKSLKDNLESTKVVEDPRQRVDVARLKQMVKRGEIQVKWVSSAMQLADSLTKRGASTDQLLRVLVGGMI
eukprot:gene21305-23382_t